MKKYNLSKIMKRAWEIKKEDSENLFSICLTIAWSEAKERKKTTMRGTEKQIAWAEDIKETVIETMRECKAMFSTHELYDPQDPAHVEALSKFDKNIETIQKEEYAGDIIELFHHIRKDKDTMGRYKEFASALSVSANPHKKNYIR